MRGLIDRLNASEILVADGATGTNLQRAGLPPGAHAEDWVLDHSEKVLDLEKSFVAAGADIILTCTFGATRVRLKGARHNESAAEVNRRAAALALQAASTGSDVLVGGSMGPLGQLLKPYGPLSTEEARAAYAEQANALSKAGVDLLVLETQYSLEEVDAALEAIRSATNLPLVVSFSYDRGTRTMMGVRPQDVIRKYQAAGAAMLGANCGTTLENMERILQEYASGATGIPWWIKPNAGLPRVEGENTIYDVSPAHMAEFARRAANMGARVIGGCCGSTPEHVAAMAIAIKGQENPLHGGLRSIV